MGNSNTAFKGMYNVSSQNPDKAENESHIYRNPLNPKMDREYEMKTIQQLLEKTFNDNNPDATCIQRRVLDDQGNPTKKTFNTTYAQYRNDAETFGKGVLELQASELRSEFRDYNLRFMGIYAGNSYRYLVQELACILYKFVSVPIYDTLGEEATVFAFSNTNMDLLCLTSNHFENMVKMKSSGVLPNLKTLILIDEENMGTDYREMAENAGFKFHTWSDVMELGRTSDIIGWEEVKEDDIYCFSYTSGTTGTPKGAMISHGNMASTIQGAVEVLTITSKDKHLHYLPMAHIMERLMFMTMFNCGCKIGVFGGDIRKIKEDLAIYKPTIFMSVPRLFNRFYDVIMGKVNAATGIKKKMVTSGIKTKLKNLEKDGDLKHWWWDTLVFSKMKAVLGGRVRFMVTGSAPLNKDVADMLKICMSCPMAEAYGQTEGTGGEFGMRITDPTSGHVGGVLPHLEFKLVDVPEMNYTNKDVCPKTGANTPRGEIWVRGHGIIPGYYKNEEKNKSTFTPDGWLQSGDIGKIVPPNNRLVIIDRKKNIFKLSQGEYIAPEKLEGNYKTCTPLITDVYIYGDSLKSCLVAVATVEKANQRALADLMNVCNDVPDDELMNSPDYEKGILELMKAKAKEVKFNKLEIPKAVVLNETPFADLGLLTTSFKPKRNDIKNHFLEQLDAKYEKLY